MRITFQSSFPVEECFSPNQHLMVSSTVVGVDSVGSVLQAVLWSNNIYYNSNNDYSFLIPPGSSAIQPQTRQKSTFYHIFFCI